MSTLFSTPKIEQPKEAKDPTAEDAIKRAAAIRKKRQGFRSTLLTGGGGDTSLAPTITSKLGGGN